MKLRDTPLFMIRLGGSPERCPLGYPERPCCLPFPGFPLVGDAMTDALRKVSRQQTIRISQREFRPENVIVRPCATEFTPLRHSFATTALHATERISPNKVDQHNEPGRDPDT
jgi:hypothetical protein